ncbi:hypothetical protein FPQ18DRAFT_157346 [Pyronema domesticum]|nr:hypothetical protein FPQ18DRAFT_157346 [Pyronema domesticum]
MPSYSPKETTSRKTAPMKKANRTGQNGICLSHATIAQCEDIEEDCRHKKNGMSADKRPDADSAKPERPKDKANSVIENVWMVKTNDRRLNSGNWFVDSGCATHVCGHKEMFETLVHYDTPRALQGFDQNIVKSYGRGSVLIKTRLPGADEVITVRIQDVW